MEIERHKRMKIHGEEQNMSVPKFASVHSGNGIEQESTPLHVIDCLDKSALSRLLVDLDDGKFGTVTKEFETLRARRMQVINLLSALRQSPGIACSALAFNVSHDRWKNNSTSQAVIELDDDSSMNGADTAIKHTSPIIILDSDEEDGDQVGLNKSSPLISEACKSQTILASQLQMHLMQVKVLEQEVQSNQLVPYEKKHADGVPVRGAGVRSIWQPTIQFEKVVLGNFSGQQPNEDLLAEPNKRVLSRTLCGKMHIQDPLNCKAGTRRGKRKNEARASESQWEKEVDASASPFSIVGMTLQTSSMGHNCQDAPESDGLDDLWKDMSLAMECSKVAKSDESAIVHSGEECEHSYVLQDDLGLVCCICGVIQKSIETIFEYQWTKGLRSSRTYMPSSQNCVASDESIPACRRAIDEFIAAEVSIHPRHMKQMKPHQLEGFSFLVRNLIADRPGGCILAHAPGSGKTFMLISFIQSFLAKYPDARTMVVLPKGILPTWKKEFQRWQVENIPLYDFYSAKADSRSQQLEMLINWENNKSILFLGYKQFSTIVCETTSDKITAACQERLLTVPSLLILDEGHTPRNDSTDIVNSLARVQTPRKVVLSGTLFQNHVKEVFNILNLVRPKFLKMESARAVKKRILSRVSIPGSKRPCRGDIDTAFFELVEDTLQNDDNYKRKISVIQDLREMTSSVLHYYRGDFLEELPGFVDFTVLLNLSSKQKEIVQRLGKFEKFKRLSVGSAVYIHPQLKDIAEKAAGDRGISDEKIDLILDSSDFRDGVKTNFLLNILSLAEAAGEKVLAFSAYHLPMKFLERTLVRMKGWHVGKEIFMITGDSSTEEREWSTELFNTSPDARLLFGSIKACGEGITLVGASRVVILDVHLNPSVTRQAIGRVFRPGQEKKVYTYRLVAADSPEEEDHHTSFKKELISKMWFEWSEYCSHRDFELEKVDIADCDDMFLESYSMEQDIKLLYRR